MSTATRVPGLTTPVPVDRPVTAGASEVRTIHARRLGCSVTLHALGADSRRTGLALQAGMARLDELDGRWSRFRPDSEVSRCNRHAGSGPTPVSIDTVHLVDAMVAAWQLTGRLVDASVLPTLESLGYDRTFDELEPAEPVRRRGVTGPASAGAVRTREATGPDGRRPRGDAGRSTAPGLSGVVVDRRASTITLPAGVRLDPGGIGKGLIADEVVAAMLGAGAVEAVADLGGDVRVGRRAAALPAATATDGEDAAGWAVDITDPFEPDHVLATVLLADGAVATSGVDARRWRTARGDAHHLIDPRTGEPASTDLVSATVVAADTVVAEALAKAAVVSGLVAAVDLLAGGGAAGLLVTDCGLAVRTAGFDDFEPPPADPPQQPAPRVPRTGGRP
jgi:thiamine biosynthesis lipoprotein